MQFASIDIGKPKSNVFPLYASQGETLRMVLICNKTENIVKKAGCF